MFAQRGHLYGPASPMFYSSSALPSSSDSFFFFFFLAGFSFLNNAEHKNTDTTR